MKRFGKDQRGFSLIELLIVIAITGIITAAITMTVFQVFNMNSRTANRMTAVSQVQNAGKLVSEDILEAQNVTPGASSGFPLILTRTAQNSTIYAVNYTLEDNELWRSESVNGGAPMMTRVAEYIDPAQTSCVLFGDALKFTVTATVGDESETRVYEVEHRSESL